MEQVGLQLILNTARRLLGGAGTQTAALAFGGMQVLTCKSISNRIMEWNKLDI
jgi:hypothetical protein